MRFGFRSRLLLAAALPAVMTVLLLLAGFLDRHLLDLEQALRDRGRAASRQLAMAAEFPLFAGNRAELNQLVAAALRGDEQIRAASVLGRDGGLRASAGQFSSWASAFDGKERIIDGDTLIVVVPIRRSAMAVDDLYAVTALAPAGAPAELLGHALVEVSRQALERQRRDMVMRIVAITLLGLGLAAALALPIATSVTRPIGHISRVVASIERGELEARADEAAAGVLAPLAAGINAMAAHVALTQEDLRHKVALATDELRQQKEAAERAARIDALTGVANRRAITELADGEVLRAQRYGTPLSLILVDIDHFKLINDTHGHPAGDGVLVCFARILSEMVREVDAVGRWGGEEFLVLLPGTGVDEAMRAAERMRGAVAECNHQGPCQRIAFTASFGVAEFERADRSFFGLFERADAALYRAKGSGRNRVEPALPRPDSVRSEASGQPDF